MMNDLLIDLVNMSFSYHGQLVLEDISLQIEDKKFYLFIGPNGGGKTTLFKIMMELIHPNQGKCVVKPAIRIGYVPQFLRFDPNFPLNVEDFVLMGNLSKIHWWGGWEKNAKKHAHALLEEFDLLPLKSHLMGELSGGQKQRALLARALVKNPEILFLDEPSSGLDVQTTKFFTKKLHELQSSMTILVITHTLSSLLDLANQVFLVHKHIKLLSKDKLCTHYDLGMYHSGEA